VELLVPPLCFVTLTISPNMYVALPLA
jgi:hypothetical protein